MLFQQTRPLRSLSRSALCGLVLCASALCGSAQNFNIDIQRGSSFGTPQNSYGGAAGQPGEWMIFAKLENQSKLLKKINGQWSPATIEWAALSGAGTYDEAPLGGPTGGDQFIHSDYLRGSGSTKLEWSLNNLQPGIYEVFVYTWGGAGDVDISVDAAPAQTLPGGTFWQGQIEGVTYSRHQTYVDPATPSMKIRAFGAGGGGNFHVCGMQLRLRAPIAAASIAEASSEPEMRGAAHPLRALVSQWVDRVRAWRRESESSSS